MKDNTNARSSVPLYQQVMDDIKGAIEAGEYAVGSQIPPEFDLASCYGVGRVTVRRAIEELSSQGYLVKQQGRGTFVTAAKLKRKIKQRTEVQSFSDACCENGMKPGARLIACRRVSAHDEDALFFGVEKGTELLCVERVRTADNIPVMLECNTFLLDGFEFLENANLTDNSIFNLVREKTGRGPDISPSCLIEIERASATTAARLDVPLGEPLFYMDVLFLDANERPLIHGRQHIVGSRYSFSI